MKVVHRDIKPSNVVLTHDWTAQLADFGMSRLTDIDRTMTKNIGTARYMAPEMLDADHVRDTGASSNTMRTLSQRRAAVDVYSFSILMAAVFNGKRPYESVPATAVMCVNVYFLRKGMMPYLFSHRYCALFCVATESSTRTFVLGCRRACQPTVTCYCSPCGL